MQVLYSFTQIFRGKGFVKLVKTICNDTLYKAKYIFKRVRYWLFSLGLSRANRCK